MTQENTINAKEYNLTADEIVAFFNDPARRQILVNQELVDSEALARAFRAWSELQDKAEIEAPINAFLQASSLLFDTNSTRDQLNAASKYRLFDLSYFARQAALDHIKKSVARFLGRDLNKGENEYLFVSLCSMR